MKGSKQPNRFTLALVTRLTLAAIAGIAAPAAMANEAVAAAGFDIPAGSLSAQLKTLAKQSSLNIQFDDSQLDNLKGAALKGSYTPANALEKLLAGSGLSARRTDNGYIVTLQQATLETVVVTGEKINRSQQGTATAVTVIKNPANQDIRSAYDIATAAPNTVHNESGIPNVRGMTGSGPAVGRYQIMTGSRPRISTSIDGIAETWGGQRYMEAGLWDVDQVEVLRGPQSTTLGRNAIAGAIVINTKDPSFYWEGALRAGSENQKNKTVIAGMVSGPLIEDELAFRLAAEERRGNNFIDYSNYKSPDATWDPSFFKHQSLRGKLLWQPQAMRGLTAKLNVSHRESKGAYLHRIEGDKVSDYAFYGKTQANRIQDSENTGISTDIALQINPALKAQLTLGYSQDITRFRQATADRFNLYQKEDSGSLEGKLVYDPADGAFKGVAGLYAFDRKMHLDVRPNTYFGNDRLKTLALFGDGTLALNSQFDLLMGARIERDSQNRDVLQLGTTRLKADVSDTIFLPKIGLDYKINPQTTIGLTARKGYNPGAGALDDNDQYYTYDKEEVNTFELSSRSRLLGDKLSLNATLFYNDYKGMQGLLNRRFSNVPKATSHGFEVQANAVLKAGLEVYGSLGLLETEIKESLPGAANLVGREFQQAPNLTASLGFKQQFANGVFFGGDIKRVGGYSSGMDGNPLLNAGNYTLANVNLGYKNARYTVRSYINNLLNEEIVYSQSLNRLGKIQEVGAPRTFGVTVDYRFY